ncbi:low molecular weight protein-tyrosine-phosphatase [Parvularcula maris]|uniref:Low molecular weight phosphotyrosine protein phosphatase n=1 Tax=Parvularcula maris TaxID=2965077 RepID=A0A9X2L6J9_9PROT|nr:low molecular weight protein-tyrosine-phosphatase [Parvularcula maris]MCQ8183879.1 low molecular weight phosphotyrosine protein phosphatase [Parvularcula maris]
MKVLFVCLGNICRSPAAEGVFRARAASRGLNIEVDSAGTGGWHVGGPSDPRMVAAAKKRGYDLSTLRARQFSDGDGFDFDAIYAMDDSNLADIEELRLPGWTAWVSKLMDQDVPDPYYGGEDGFEHVLDLLEEASDRILSQLAT